jgi:arylsulfatase A-like enzyme
LKYTGTTTLQRPLISKNLIAEQVFQSCRKANDLQPFQNADADNNDVSAVELTKPNIIIILADDVGYYIPAVNGGQSYQTPNNRMPFIKYTTVQVHFTIL